MLPSLYQYRLYRPILAHRKKVIGKKYWTLDPIHTVKNISKKERLKKNLNRWDFICFYSYHPVDDVEEVYCASVNLYFQHQKLSIHCSLLFLFNKTTKQILLQNPKLLSSRCLQMHVCIYWPDAEDEDLIVLIKLCHFPDW